MRCPGDALSGERINSAARTGTILAFAQTFAVTVN